MFGWVCGRVCVGGWVRGWTGWGQNLRKAELSLGLRFQVTSPAQPFPPPPSPWRKPSNWSLLLHHAGKPLAPKAKERTGVSTLSAVLLGSFAPSFPSAPFAVAFVSCRSSVGDLWNPYFVFRAGRECHACASPDFPDPPAFSVFRNPSSRTRNPDKPVLPLASGVCLAFPGEVTPREFCPQVIKGQYLGFLCWRISPANRR